MSTPDFPARQPRRRPALPGPAHQLAQLVRKRGLARVGETSRLRGVSDSAAWLVDSQAAEPQFEPDSPRPSEARQP